MRASTVLAWTAGALAALYVAAGFAHSTARGVQVAVVLTASAGLTAWLRFLTRRAWRRS